MIGDAKKEELTRMLTTNTEQFNAVFLQAFSKSYYYVRDARMQARRDGCECIIL